MFDYFNLTRVCKKASIHSVRTNILHSFVVKILSQRENECASIYRLNHRKVLAFPSYVFHQVSPFNEKNRREKPHNYVSMAALRMPLRLAGKWWVFVHLIYNFFSWYESLRHASNDNFIYQHIVQITWMLLLNLSGRSLQCCSSLCARNACIHLKMEYSNYDEYKTN